ncbi:MAG: hypothetical protein RR324_01100, partial [Cellulosilyticaceae bacterium]
MDHMFWSTETGELVKVSTIQNGVVYLVNGEEYDIEAFVKEFVELDDPTVSARYKRITGPELWRRVKTIEYLESYLLTNADDGILDADQKDELKTLIMFYEGRAK